MKLLMGFWKGLGLCSAYYGVFRKMAKEGGRMALGVPGSNKHKEKEKRGDT